MEHDDGPAMDFDGDGNMTALKQGDYEILIERNSDGSIAFWTDSHGNSDTGCLPVPDETLIFADGIAEESLPFFTTEQLIQQQPESVKWCLDPNLMPQGKIPEAECPGCDRPISRCGCA